MSATSFPERERHASSCGIHGFVKPPRCTCAVGWALELQAEKVELLELVKDMPIDLRMSNQQLRRKNHALALERDALRKQLRTEGT